MSEPVDTKELRRLLAASSPGQLSADEWYDNWFVGVGEPDFDEDGDLNYPKRFCDGCRKEDAKLIAEVINALPALLDEIERLRNETAK